MFDVLFGNHVRFSVCWCNVVGIRYVPQYVERTIYRIDSLLIDRYALIYTYSYCLSALYTLSYVFQTSSGDKDVPHTSQTPAPGEPGVAHIEFTDEVCDAYTQ